MDFNIAIWVPPIRSVQITICLNKQVSASMEFENVCFCFSYQEATLQYDK